MLLVIATSAALVPSLRAQESSSCVGGIPSAPIKIEVFSDYQCPACRNFYLNTMRNVLTEYADVGKACVVYREFPLQMHAHARVAARYGHAAKSLGVRQWAQVTDALFLAQDEWAKSGDVESAVAKGLSPEDMAAVRKQLQNPALLDAAIDSDVNLGLQRDVNSTPTFFVTAHGKTEKVASAIQYPIFKRYLDSLLAYGQ
jgi:protein-disulfide isomerase